MTIQKDETREYVAAITAELVKMAQQAELPFLAYLLGMAQSEASGRTSVASNPQPRAAAKPTGQDARASH